MTPDEAPTVDAYLLRREQGVSLVFLCRYCRSWHFHGNCGPKLGDGDGHRVAHCFDSSGSPYRETGYVLRMIGEITERGMDDCLREMQPSGAGA